MTLVKTLEDVVVKLWTPVRIAPAGAIGITIGTVGASASITEIYLENIPVPMRFVMEVAGGLFPLAIYGAIQYVWGVQYYKRARRLMKMQAAGKHIEGIIAPDLDTYCERNACHAAAKVSGFGPEFDEIIKQYPKPKKSRWLPGI